MFSKTCEYAVRATLYIAQQSQLAETAGVDAIALAIDAPRSFTAKILQQLSKNDIVSSVKGPNGGFYISNQRSRQPVKSILKALGEDHLIEKCVLGLDRCSDKRPCPLHNEYKGIKKQLMTLFESKSIAELAEDVRIEKSYIHNFHKR